MCDFYLVFQISENGTKFVFMEFKVFDNILFAQSLI